MVVAAAAEDTAPDEKISLGRRRELVWLVVPLRLVAVIGWHVGPRLKRSIDP